MVVRRIGGGILLAVSVAVPLIIDKMDVHLTGEQGAALLTACAIIFILGLLLALWPERAAAPSRNPDGIYQHGEEVGRAQGVIERLHQGFIDFQAISAGGRFNPHQPFEYRDYVLDFGMAPNPNERKIIAAHVHQMFAGISARVVGKR